MLLPLALIFTSLTLSFGLECGSPGDSFHHETDSRSYYICDDNNHPMQFMCPDGQVYDRNQRKCDLAENVEFYLHTDSSADHEATDLQDNAELETPQRFVLDIKDLKTAMEKLGKPKNDNLEEQLKDKENLDQHDTENIKEIEKREINEDEEDANKEGDAVNESQVKEDTKTEDDKAEKSTNTENFEISKDESVEGIVSKDEVENSEEQSEKEIEDTVLTSGLASPTEQKELFPSLPMYTGFVPLNKEEQSKSSSAIYGYQEDFEEDDKGVATDGVNKEDELELTKKDDNNEDAFDKSGEKIDNVEEDKGILEGKDSKTNEGDEEKSIEDENTDGGDKQVDIEEEETQEGDQVDESIVQKSDEEVNNAKNNSDETKTDNDEQEDKNDEPKPDKAEKAHIGDDQENDEDEEKDKGDEQKTDKAEQAGNSDEQKTDKDEQEDKVDEPKPDEDKEKTGAKE